MTTSNKTVEEILLNRVLHIGDNEWKLKGYPQKLIDELEELIQSERQKREEIVKELEKEIEIHSVYPMTDKQEQETFVDGIVHALRVITSNYPTQ